MERKDIERIACIFMKALNMHGHGSEVDLSLEATDFYKPFYRSTGLFWGRGTYFFEVVLGGETPTMEEAAEIVRLAHPYFVRALEMDWGMWEHHWEGMEYAWTPQPGWVCSGCDSLIENFICACPQKVWGEEDRYE